MLTLPTVKTGPSKKWSEQKFLTIGQGKLGKSHFWSMGDKTLFLEFEAGLNHLECLRVPVRSWEEFVEVLNALYKAHQAGQFPYDTLVVDTLDRMIDLGNEYVIDRAREKYEKSVGSKIETIGDIPNGAGWFNASNLIRITLDKMKAFPAALVLIGHTKLDRLKDGTREYTKATINIGGQMGTGLIHWADHTLHWKARLRGDTIERNIRTVPSEELEAGSRGSVVPDGFRIDGDMKASYQKFRSLFTD